MTGSKSHASLLVEGGIEPRLAPEARPLAFTQLVYVLNVHGLPLPDLPPSVARVLESPDPD